MAGETQREPTYTHTHEITHTCVTDCSPWIYLQLFLSYLLTLVQLSGCLECSKTNYQFADDISILNS